MTEPARHDSREAGERDIVLAIAGLGLVCVMGAVWFFLS